VQAAIEARAVGVRTRAGEVVVRDISMTVGHGELVAITGDGAGKTALLDAASGLRPPTSGAVARCSLAGAGPRPGYVPADDVLPPVLPLAAALRYTAALRAARGAQQPGDNVLSMAGLSSRAAARCGELDPGERKRAAVAAELLSGPDQLFLDGPTSGLDPAQAAEVLSLLRRLAGSGITVLLTTSSPLDVARCDKVAVLAAGGHLAFFGTPDAARGYFGADSLEEIYERLAGVGDPAAAWSRRFFHFSQVSAGFSPVPPAAPAPGPAFLVPDSAGPHSAGRVTVLPGQASHGDNGRPGLAAAARDGQAVQDAPGVRAGLARGVRQLPVLVSRNIDVVRRSVLASAVLVAAPAAVLLAFAVLIGAGAFDAVWASLAWTVFGGFCIGLAYGLPQVRGELGGLRAERFCGLSATGYVLAKLAVLLPALAAADAVALVVPAGLGRLPHGYGPAYLTLLLSSAVALAQALLLSATALLPPTALAWGRPLPVTATWLPALLLAFAVLTLLDRPVWPDWLVLGLLAVALAAGLTVLIARRVPVVPGGRPAARF
jgi:ABC-type multidrug transport system ATPase subunit